MPATYTFPAHKRGDTWKNTKPFQVLLKSGDPFSAVANASTNLVTAAAHGLSNGDIVTVAVTAGGLTKERRYYVVGATTNTFQFALTAGGAAIDLTAASTHSVQLWEPPAAALAHARIQFRRNSPTGAVGLEVTDENGKLVIADAVAWKFSIPDTVAAPPLAGSYYWDLETVDESGVIKTYLEGVWEITQDTTRVAAE
jgi:hypothetical protein